MADVLNRLPQVGGRLAKDSHEVVVPAKLGTKPVQEALPIEYRSAGATLRDNAGRIVELEKEFGQN